MASILVERTSRLAAGADVVWAHAASMTGINAELAPISMSHPAHRAVLGADTPLGVPLFTSTLRLGGVPFDRHVLTIVDLRPGRSFQEDSRSLLHRRWRHRREVIPMPGGCALSDRLEIDPRVPGAGPVTRWVVGWVFTRRHRVLAQRFGLERLDRS